MKTSITLGAVSVIHIVLGVGLTMASHARSPLRTGWGRDMGGSLMMALICEALWPVARLRLFQIVRNMIAKSIRFVRLALITMDAVRAVPIVLPGGRTSEFRARSQMLRKCLAIYDIE